MAPLWLTRYIGVPYLPRRDGRDGADCWGIVRLVNREQFGRELPDYLHVEESELPALVQAESAGRGCWRAVEPAAAAVGDLVLLRLGRFPVHVGLVVDADLRLMLHTLRGSGSCAERWDSVRWAARVEGFYRWDS